MCDTTQPRASTRLNLSTSLCANDFCGILDHFPSSMEQTTGDISVAPAVVSETPAVAPTSVETPAPVKKPSSGMAWRKPVVDASAAKTAADGTSIWNYTHH